MSTFALVHGAWHAPYLPSDDESASFDDCADVICAALADVDGDDLIVVEHSLAGQIVPLVTARRPVRRLVYLCAMPPIPGKAFIQQIADEAAMLHPGYTRGLGGKDSKGRFAWVDKELAHFHLFGDCDERTASAAFARLRPQATGFYRVPCSLSALPVVESTYVVCEEDRIVTPEWSKRIAHEWLNADIIVIEMPGSHSPFFSRPKALAQLLSRLT